MHYAAQIASVFGPLLIILGIWTIFHKENVRKVAESIIKVPAILYLGGIINLILGLIIINLHPFWRVNLAVLVTILGWVLFIRGLCDFFLPNLRIKMMRMEHSMWIICGLISVVWGLGLCWLAFY